MYKLCKHIILFTSVVLTIVFTACEETTTWDIQQGQEFVVVDAIITNEYRYQVMRITRSSQEMNQAPRPVSNVEIQLTDGVNSIAFIEDSLKPGRYLSQYPFRAAAGRTYQLCIRSGENVDTASATMEAITPMEAAVIVAYDSLFRFTYIPSDLPSMMEVYYIWSSVPEYCEKYGACYAAEVFYILSIIDVSKEFGPPKQVIIFPEGTMIIRRKYSLSEPHQHFIRSLLLETEWRGGLFDVEQGNVPSNFKHGTRGWFAACMVLTDTTHFD